MKPDLERKVHQIYDVVGFRSVGPYTLEIAFNDGIIRKIDFEGVLEGDLYGPLKDMTLFQQVKLDGEGGNLVWPGGADFDPEILHDWPERKAAMLTAAVRWRKGEHAARNGKASAVEAIWEGLIAFGLVQFPVNLYPATEVVRGLEVERDNLAVISDDALKEAVLEKSVAIEIQEFVYESQIPTLYFEKPYYLEPGKGAGKAYALLREALAKSKKVGVAQFVLRNRENLCVLKAQGNALILNTLRFASEIRSADELRLPVNKKLVPTVSEVNLAMKLIEDMTTEFDPANYHDTYAEDGKKLIKDKAKGEKREAPPRKPARSNVIDLAAALRESLAQTKPRKRGAA